VPNLGGCEGNCTYAPSQSPETSIPTTSPITSNPTTSDPTVTVGFCSKDSTKQCTVDTDCASCVDGKHDGVLCSDVKHCNPGTCDDAVCKFD
jgi:hypothetical protein